MLTSKAKSFVTQVDGILIEGSISLILIPQESIIQIWNLRYQFATNPNLCGVFVNST